jgi:leucyl aminopeptidase (aminopeptidase T)
LRSLKVVASAARPQQEHVSYVVSCATHIASAKLVLPGLHRIVQHREDFVFRSIVLDEHQRIIGR